MRVYEVEDYLREIDKLSIVGQVLLLCDSKVYLVQRKVMGHATIGIVQ